MATGIYYKAKDVRNCLIVFFVFIYCTGSAQSSPSKKISLSIQKAPLYELIDQLSLATGLHFIYSPDKIKSKGLYSITISNKTVIETLQLASTQLNLEFRQQGEYVIVKANEFGQLIAKADVPIQPELRLRPQIPLTTFYAASPAIPTSPVIIREVKLLQPDSISRITKYLKPLQAYFDSTWLKRIPVQYVQRLNKNNKHRGWFVAAGGLINDYSRGFELEAGIRSAYLVYSPSWLSSGQFHGSYGIGSSILLRGNFTLNPVYTYTNVNWKYPTEYAMARLMYGPSQLKVTTQHHQVKLLLRYSVTPNVLLQAGPSFNRATTDYHFSESDRDIFRGWISSSMASSMPESKPATAKPGQAQEIYHPKPSSFQCTKTWVGFEASLLFRINFK